MCRRSESEACSRAADGEDYGDKTPWACSRRGRRPRLPSRAKLGFRHYCQAAVSYLMKTRGKITMATQFESPSYPSAKSSPGWRPAAQTRSEERRVGKECR